MMSKMRKNYDENNNEKDIIIRLSLIDELIASNMNQSIIGALLSVILFLSF